MNINMGYSQWIAIANGVVGPRSWTKLHLSEIFAIVGLFLILWLAAGREIIAVDSANIRIRREILGIGWSRNFQLADVRNIRSGWFLDPKAAGKWNPDDVRAGLYFDYQGKIHSFGNGMTTKDALRIEEAVRQSFPQIVLNRG